MIKGSRRLIYIMIVMTLMVIIYAFVAKNSIIEDIYAKPLVEYMDDEVSIMEDKDLSDIYFKNDIETIEELEDSSEYIVKCRMLGDRENFLQCSKASVEVEKVYKGDDINVGDDIYIYEPSSIIFDGASNARVDITFGYNFMQENKEYILFFNKLVVPEGYKYKGDEEKTYLIASSYFGKYSVEDNNGAFVIDEEDDKTYTYGELIDYEIITRDEKIAKDYDRISVDARKKYK